MNTPCLIESSCKIIHGKIYPKLIPLNEIKNASDSQIKAIHLLGKGEYGEVFRVTLINSQEFALKCFSEKSNLRGNLREIATLNTFKDHPNIIQIIDLHWEIGAGFLMECMQGTLCDLYRDKKYDRFQFFESITLQSLTGLHILYTNKMCHRDIKPQNILYKFSTPYSIEIKISDFGLTRRLEDYSEGSLFSGYIVSQYYRAPELWMPNRINSLKHYDCSIDVWALVITLIEYALGCELFHTSELDEKIIDLKNNLSGGFYSKQYIKEAVDNCIITYIYNSIFEYRSCSLMGDYFDVRRYIQQHHSEFQVTENHALIIKNLADVLKYDDSKRSTPYRLIKQMNDIGVPYSEVIHWDWRVHSFDHETRYFPSLSEQNAIIQIINQFEHKSKVIDSLDYMRKWSMSHYYPHFVLNYAIELYFLFITLPMQPTKKEHYIRACSSFHIACNLYYHTEPELEIYKTILPDLTFNQLSKYIWIFMDQFKPKLQSIFLSYKPDRNQQYIVEQWLKKYLLN